MRNFFFTILALFKENKPTNKRFTALPLFQCVILATVRLVMILSAKQNELIDLFHIFQTPIYHNVTQAVTWPSHEICEHSAHAGI